MFYLHRPVVSTCISEVKGKRKNSYFEKLENFFLVLKEKTIIQFFINVFQRNHSNILN